MFLIDDIKSIAGKIAENIKANITVEKAEELIKQAAPSVFGIAEDVVVDIEKEYVESGDVKRELAIQAIKKALDNNVYDVPDMLDEVEEFIIGQAVDFVVNKFNNSGIFSHKEAK
jgi:hypothetical protein